MKTKQSQDQLVLDYMQKHGSITTYKAYNELGVTRLSAKIFNLKEKGFDIRGDFITVLNRRKEECRVKEYKLLGHTESFWEKLLKMASFQ